MHTSSIYYTLDSRGTPLLKEPENVIVSKISAAVLNVTAIRRGDTATCPVICRQVNAAVVIPSEASIVTSRYPSTTIRACINTSLRSKTARDHRSCKSVMISTRPSFPTTLGKVMLPLIIQNPINWLNYN